MSALHADAVQTLTAWSAPDEQQARLRDRFVDPLREHPDAVHVVRAGGAHPAA